MRRKKEKRFKKIKIENYHSESLQSSWFEYFKTLFLIYLIAFGIISLAIIVLYYIYNKIIYKKILYDFSSFLKNNNNITSNISESSNNYNDEKMNEIIKNNPIFRSNISKIKKEIYETPYNQPGIGDPYISVIIVTTNSKNENLEALLDSIYRQTFKNVEIVILDDNKLNNNTLIYKKIKEQNKKGIKIIIYESKVGKLRKRIDGVNNSKSPFLLVIDSDDNFNIYNILEKIYNHITENNVDILEFNSNSIIKDVSVIHQPILFDKIYFTHDNFYPYSNLYLTGKLIKKELLINVLDSIDIFYKEQNMNYFDEDLILYPLFKNAKSFKLLKISGTKKYYYGNNAFGWKKNDNEFIIKDFFLYINYIFKISGNNVTQKRRLARIFINTLTSRKDKFPKINFINFFNDTIKLFLDCEKISDNDKDEIKKYQDFVLDNKQINFALKF